MSIEDIENKVLEMRLRANDPTVSKIVLANHYKEDINLLLSLISALENPAPPLNEASIMAAEVVAVLHKHGFNFMPTG